MLMKFLLLAALVYLALAVFFYFTQRSFIYFPDKNLGAPSDYGVAAMDVISVLTDDGLTLKAWYKPPSSPDKPVLLMFHGNAGHIGIRAFKARIFMDQGYGFLLAEYRGYGGNPGRISEEGLYRDGRAYMTWLKNKGISSSRVVVHGESLGTGVAVQMATEYQDVHAVVLETPYTTLRDVAQKHMFYLPVKLLMKDRFDNLAKIKNVVAPLLIVHGTADMIVPYQQARRLYEAAGQPKKLETLSLSGHNNTYVFGAGQKIAAFLAQLEKN